MALRSAEKRGRCGDDESGERRLSSKGSAGGGRKPFASIGVHIVPMRVYVARAAKSEGGGELSGDGFRVSRVVSPFALTAVHYLLSGAC